MPQLQRVRARAYTRPFGDFVGRACALKGIADAADQRPHLTSAGCPAMQRNANTREAAGRIDGIGPPLPVLTMSGMRDTGARNPTLGAAVLPERAIG